MKVGTWRDGLRPIIRLFTRLLFLVLGAAGALLGAMGGEQLAPRNDAVVYGCAAAGIALAVLAWFPICGFLHRLVAPRA